ncbi:FG-GAP-like repeat-containing protein [uncultured Maribacter sp.]|uniref:FG-GAP-like repeat-containing protein n=1 Tax=uncultured Maribacter sp. TaxID=431308 RepID=UPI00262A4D94|nr:FG-GAP-like repeat-containing protein [uncultured Maribacter sp.]
MRVSLIKRINLSYLGFFIIALSSISKLQAQTTFSESASSYGLDLGQNKDGGHAWSDFNDDGLLDVLVLENSNSSSVKSFLMRQGPAGTFTNVQATLVPGMLGDYAERQAVWGDINGDGKPDFMINSSGNSNSRKAIQIFIQNTDGTFGDGIGGSAPITIGRTGATINISGVNSEGTGFFDFEGDGDLDVFFDNHGSGIELLRNNYIDHTTHTVVNPVPSALFTHITPGNGNGVVEYGLNQFATDGDYGSAADVNDDGWVDIFMRKRDENDFFLNQGGTFTSGADLAQAANNNKGANGLWDLDNDGDLDAVWTENGLTQIFRNDGPGVWTPLGAPTFPGLPQPSNTNNGSSSNDIDGLAAGDIDNDGDIDILFVGDSRSYLFINLLNSPTPAPGVIGSGSAMSFSLDSETFNSANGEGTTMVDIDDDGDLDIYMNINGSSNQLFINNLPAANRNNHLLIDVTEDRGANGSTGGLPARVAIGTNVLIKDCAGNIISGLRQVNGVYGHGTQSPEEVHFGLPLGENETYIIEVRYPNFYDATDPNGFSRLISTIIATPSTIPGTNHYSLSTTDAEIVENINAPIAEDDSVIVPMGNTVSVQISLFDNDSEPDGEDFFIESVLQPAIGSVVIDDADLGLVTYTYSAGTLFTGTSFDYTITDSTVSICPALGKNDTATVYIEEPCADLSGVDTDGDGINDICDLDDDNDGILDSVESPKTVLWVTQNSPNSEEQNTINKLIELGYTVTVVDDNVGGNANDYAVTFIYERVNSGTAYANVDNLNSTTRGVITSENALYDEIIGTTGSTGSTSTNFINIINNTHPITSGLTTGNYDVGDADFYVNGVVSGTELGRHPNGQKDFVVWEPGDLLDTGIAPGRRTILPLTRGFNTAGEDLLVKAIIWTAGIDTDKDGITNDLDLDSDGDGIPDNVEAQTTLGYIISNNDSAATYATNSGVNSAYLGGLTPTNTDGADNPDYIDLNSDNEGHNDTTEAGIALAGEDTDNDGLDDAIDTDLVGYTDPGGTIDNPLTPSQLLLDNDNDAAIGGDVDFRDASDDRPDNDNDNIVDALDFDDDNDGILDTDEGCGNLIINGSFEQQDFTDAIVFSGGFTDASGTFIGTTYNTNTLAGWTYTQNQDGWVGAQSPGWSSNTFADSYHGNQYIDVMGNNNVTGGVNNVLSQVMNTTVGNTYKFSFFWGEDVGHSAGSQVTLDVKVLDSGNNVLISQTLLNKAEGVIAGIIGPKKWFYFERTFVATTTQTSVSFEATPSYTADGAALDFITVEDVSTCRDTDNDGIPDSMDLDSDNDGIYDVIEAGHNVTHTNGKLTGTVGLDGVPNSVQASGQEDSGTVNYTLLNSDIDSNYNFIEIDSDGDGCNDSDEAYGDVNADIDNNGMYGSGSPVVNADGSVSGASYALPADGDNNGIFDFLQVAVAPVITDQPQDQTVLTGDDATFTTSVTNADSFQWQVSIDGVIFTDLVNDIDHTGAQTASLTVLNVPKQKEGYSYRVLVSNSSNTCTVITSNASLLSIKVRTVITNKRITYRIKPN